MRGMRYDRSKHAVGTVTLGASYEIMSASLTYVNQVDDDVLPDVEDGGGYDVEVYGMIGVRFEY